MELNATIFLQIFIFMTLLLWLSSYLFKPILLLFDERERRIEGARSEAFRLNGLADEKAKTFDDEYAKAKDVARQTLSQWKAEMEKGHIEAIDQAKSLARRKVKESEKVLAGQEQEARKQLATISDVLADEIVNTLLSSRA